MVFSGPHYTGGGAVLQEARQPASEATTDAGADDLKTLAAKLRKKHRSGTASQPQQTGTDRSKAAEFLAGSATGSVPNGTANPPGDQPRKKKRKTAIDDQPPMPKKNKKAHSMDAPLAKSVTTATDSKQVSMKGGAGKGWAEPMEQKQMPVHTKANGTDTSLQRTKLGEARKRTSVTDARE